MKFKLLESLEQDALKHKTPEEFANKHADNVWIHSTDAKNFDKFNTSEVWFEYDALGGYGDREIAIHYEIKKPFVTSSDEFIHQDFHITAEEARKNKELYHSWGGEANPESFEKMRKLGYETLIDDEGFCALYPNKVTIIAHRAKWKNGDFDRKGMLIKFWKKAHAK
jgi:hypothetical protein